MHRLMGFRVRLFLAILGLFALTLTAPAQNNGRGRKYKAPPPTAKITIMVIRDSNNKPIENAAVIFTLTTEKGNMEMKTDFEGKAVLDVLPIDAGCRLQVIAKGYQTYGEDFKIDKAEMSKEIRMRRPGEQFSIYKQNPGSGEQKPKEGAEQPK